MQHNGHHTALLMPSELSQDVEQPPCAALRAASDHITAAVWRTVQPCCAGCVGPWTASWVCDIPSHSLLGALCMVEDCYVLSPLMHSARCVVLCRQASSSCNRGGVRCFGWRLSGHVVAYVHCVEETFVHCLLLFTDVQSLVFTVRSGSAVMRQVGGLGCAPYVTCTVQPTR